MSTRTLLLIGAVALSGTLAASCEGPSPEPTVTPNPTATPIPPASATPIPTATELPIEATEPAATPTEIADPVLRGESLAARYGCAVCHSPDGSPKAGPTWLGLFGSEESLADGSTVIVDEPYVIESIFDPNAKITRGFTADIMPKDFGEKLSDSDIEAIIAYMQSLSE